MMALVLHLRDLEVGDHVVWNGREWPLTVRSLEETDETDEGVQYTHEAVLDGPRGGKVVLKETSSGRVLKWRGGTPPPHVVRGLHRYRRG